MITVGDKTWDKLKPEEKIAFCEGLFKEAKDARRLRDLEWYMNYMFLDGNHYATYNKTQNRIQQKPRKKGEVRISINLIRSSIRAIQNYATRFEPKWEVQPGDEDDDTIKNSRKYGKFLDYLYRTLHWEITVESMVDSLLNTSVCFVEVDWDPKAADGKGQVMLFDHDSFDIYVDRSAYIPAEKNKVGARKGDASAKIRSWVNAPGRLKTAQVYMLQGIIDGSVSPDQIPFIAAPLANTNAGLAADIAEVKEVLGQYENTPEAEVFGIPELKIEIAALEAEANLAALSGQDVNSFEDAVNKDIRIRAAQAIKSLSPVFVVDGNRYQAPEGELAVEIYEAQR